MKSPHVVLVQMECLVGRAGLNEDGVRYTIEHKSAELTFHGASEEERGRLVEELGAPSKIVTHAAEARYSAFTVAHWTAVPPRRCFVVKAFGWPAPEEKLPEVPGSLLGDLAARGVIVTQAPGGDA